MTTIRVPTSRQGQTGMGQGGFTAYKFTEAIGKPVTVALKNPIPLDKDLDVIDLGDRWHLLDPAHPDVPIMEATNWAPDFADTEPVTVEDADAARSNFPLSAQDHPAPHCLSCGMGERSLRVHAGALGDGRWASPFKVPPWATTDDAVDMSLLWMAMDCACGWYISHSSRERRQSVTVQFAVGVYDTIVPETDYALVAWHGDYQPDWDGRKRGAAAALFDANGACIAQSRSFWLSLP